MSRETYLLHRKLEKLCKLHQQELWKHGIELLITCTYRNPVEQGPLVLKGKSGAKISWHNFMPALAYDVVPLVNGKADWESEHWELIGKTGENLGLVWGGRWTSIVDKCHFEWHPGYKDNEQAKALNDWAGYAAPKTYELEGKDGTLPLGDCSCGDRVDTEDSA